MKVIHSIVDAYPGADTAARWRLAAYMACIIHACLLFGLQWNEPSSQFLSGAGEPGVEIDLEAMIVPLREPADLARTEILEESVFAPMPNPEPEIWTDSVLPVQSQPQVEPIRPVAPQMEKVEPRKTAQARKALKEPVRTQQAAPAPLAEARPEAVAGSHFQSIVLPPSPLSNPKPAYPPVARQRGQEGLVILVVDVDDQGLPVTVNIEKSSSHRLLDQAAVKAIMKWRFNPARKAGVPVSGRILIPVEFRLHEVP